MRPTLFNAGTMFSLVALGLQLVICSLGGRLCYQPSLPAPAEHCPTGCCAAEKAPPPTETSWVTFATVLPGVPSDADCCLELSPEHLYSVTSVSLETMPDLVAPTLAVMATDTHPSVRQIGPDAPARLASLPPPSLATVRTCVLRL